MMRVLLIVSCVIVACGVSASAQAQPTAKAKASVAQQATAQEQKVQHSGQTIAGLQLMRAAGAGAAQAPAQQPLPDKRVAWMTAAQRSALVSGLGLGEQAANQAAGGPLLRAFSAPCDTRICVSAQGLLGVVATSEGVQAVMTPTGRVVVHVPASHATALVECRVVVNGFASSTFEVEWEGNKLTQDVPGDGMVRFFFQNTGGGSFALRTTRSLSWAFEGCQLARLSQ